MKSRRSKVTLFFWFIFSFLTVGAAGAIFSDVSDNLLVIIVPGVGILIVIGVFFLLSLREQVAFDENKVVFQPVFGSSQTAFFEQVDYVRMYQQEKKVVVGDHHSWSWWLSFYDGSGRKLVSFDAKILNKRAMQKLTAILKRHGLTITK